MPDNLLEGETQKHKRCLHQNDQKIKQKKQRRDSKQVQQQIFIDSTCIRWKCDIEIKI